MKLAGSLQRINAISWKEWIQIKRDARSLILSLFAPVFLLMLFGYALTVDVRHVKTAIYDQDMSHESRMLLEKFSHTEYLDIEGSVVNYRELDRVINNGDAVMAIVIPKGWGSMLKSGRNTSIQLIVDGSDSTSATVAAGYVKAILAEYNMGIMMSGLSRIGLTEFTIPVDVRSRVWYNPELLSKNFIIPGLIVIFLAFISALIASLTISREWERGTMETLITTPVRSWEMLAGKLVPYIFIGLFDVVITACAGYFVFDVPFRGKLFEFCLLALLFLMSTSGMGILISAATRVQVLSVQFAMVTTYLPSFILSGFIFPIENMPAIIRGFTYIIPAKYMIFIAKSIALKGVGAAMLTAQILFLMIFTVIILAVCIKKLRLMLPEN
jgi:ABC-2 type transport system permease protein